MEGGVDVAAGEPRQLLLKRDVPVLEVGQAHLEVVIPPLDGALLGLEGLDLLSLAFPRGLGGTTVTEDAFDTALLLFVFGLGSFSGWRVSGR